MFLGKRCDVTSNTSVLWAHGVCAGLYSSTLLHSVSVSLFKGLDLLTEEKVSQRGIEREKDREGGVVERLRLMVERGVFSTGASALLGYSSHRLFYMKVWLQHTASFGQFKYLVITKSLLGFTSQF